MSEHESTSRQDDDVNLTEADLARALATSLDRGHRLVRRRNQRRAALGGVGAVALLASGFGVINSLSDDGTTVSVTPAVEGTSVERTTTTVPATSIPVETTTVATTIVPDTTVPGSVLAPAASTTTTPPVPTSTPRIPDDPPGFTRTDLANGQTVLVNTNPLPPNPTTSAAIPGVDVGGAGASVTRADAVRSARFLSPYVLRVELECDPLTEIGTIRYRRIGTEVTVQASSDGNHVGDSCASGVRPPIDLVFRAGDLPSNVTVVAGILDAE